MSGIHFKWLRTRSAWQDMEYHRVKRAAALKEDQANMDAINSAMANALQNKISGSSTNAAYAALKRIQAAAKAKTAETTKQLDNAQNLIDQTKASLSATSTTSTTATTSVLDTVV